jgi:Ca2+-binding RTX toxin-like protein
LWAILASLSTLPQSQTGHQLIAVLARSIFVCERKFHDFVPELFAGSAGVDRVQSSVTFSLADTVHAKGAIENLTLTGALAINATGNTLANTLIGNGAANALNGGLGLDTMTGGLGNDTFLFTTAPTAANIDKITDFNNVADTIKLENTGAGLFNALGLGTLAVTAFVKGAGFVSAKDATDRIVYNTTTGDLFYDRDGLGGVAAVKFATLTTHPLTVTNADFVII